jgi:hypothetical protein
MSCGSGQHRHSCRAEPAAAQRAPGSPVVRDLIKRAAQRRAREQIRRLRVRYGERTSRRRTLPDFLVIGTRRGATTSLWRYLIQYPLCRGSSRRGAPRRRTISRTTGRVVGPGTGCTFRRLGNGECSSANTADWLSRLDRSQFRLPPCETFYRLPPAGRVVRPDPRPSSPCRRSTCRPTTCSTTARARHGRAALRGPEANYRPHETALSERRRHHFVGAVPDTGSACAPAALIAGAWWPSRASTRMLIHCLSLRIGLTVNLGSRSGRCDPFLSTRVTRLITPWEPWERRRSRTRCRCCHCW